MFCRFFRLEYGGDVLQAIYRCGGEEMEGCVIVGYVVSNAWMEWWVTFCGFGAW